MLPVLPVRKTPPEAIWEEVLNLFWMLEQCYNDEERYHYIGWMRHFSEAQFSTLHKLYKWDKLNFTQNLQKIIIVQTSRNFIIGERHHG